MVDSSPPGTGSQVFVDKVRDAQVRLDTLSAATGTQRGRLVGRLFEVVDSIPVTEIYSQEGKPPTVPKESWKTVQKLTIDPPEGKSHVVADIAAVATFLDTSASEPLIHTRIAIQGSARYFLASYFRSDNVDGFYESAHSDFWEGDLGDAGALVVELQAWQNDVSNGQVGGHSVDYAGVSALVTFTKES